MIVAADGCAALVTVVAAFAAFMTEVVSCIVFVVHDVSATIEL